LRENHHEGDWRAFPLTFTKTVLYKYKSFGGMYSFPFGGTHSFSLGVGTQYLGAGGGLTSVGLAG
jgi:hypothetical protein